MAQADFHLAQRLHRPDIDGLRALAIAGVLAYHAFPSVVRGGFVGVDVFFVISGYVVSLSLFARDAVSKRDAIISFYARRIRRLFPALLTVLVTLAVVGCLVLPSTQLTMLGKHILGSAGFIQNLVLWDEAGYFDAASHEKWLLHLWSLGIEEQFYLLLPIIIFTGRAGAHTPQRLWCVGMLGLGSLLLSLWQSRHAPSAGFYLPFGRFWEFLLGVLLAGCTVNRGAPPEAPSQARHAVGALAGTAVVLSFLFLDTQWQGWQFPGPQSLVPALATAAVLWSRGAWVNQSLLNHRLMVYLGLISYPLYLWHWPIFAYLNTLDSGHELIWTRVTGICLAVVLASVTYHFIERPLRGLRRSGFPLRWVSVLALVSLGGLTIWTTPGWSRLDRMQQAAAREQRWDPATLYRDDTCLSQPDINPSGRRDFFCRGDPAMAQWVLLGDSHANALAAGVMKAMPGSWLNLGGGGCMPFGGVDSGSDYLGLQCPHELPEAFLRHIKSNDGIRGVVIHLRGPYYVKDDGVGLLEPGERRWLKPAYSTAALVAAGNAEIFRAGVRRSLAELAAAGKQVVWMLDTPVIGVDTVNCLQPRPGQGWLEPPRVSRRLLHLRMEPR